MAAGVSPGHAKQGWLTSPFPVPPHQDDNSGPQICPLLLLFLEEALIWQEFCLIHNLRILAWIIKEALT